MYVSSENKDPERQSQARGSGLKHIIYNNNWKEAKGKF